MSIHSIKIMPRLTVHARRALYEERRTQILQAAATVFSQKGFDAATIRDIARAASMAEGSIYLYFKNKQDLLVHLPRQFIQPPVESLRAASMSDAAPTPEELLNAIARNITQVVLQNRELVRVLFTSLPTMDQATRATYVQEGPMYALEFLEGYIRAQQAAGVFRADIDPAITARSLPGMMLFFLLVQEVLHPGDMPRFEYDAVVPNVVQVFLHGVMNPAPAAAPNVAASAKTKIARRSRKRAKQPVAIE